MNHDQIDHPKNHTLILIICIGDGSAESDRQAKSIADHRQLPYRQVLDDSTHVVYGVYHTSVYDVKISRLLEKIKDFKPIIEVLDISRQSYADPADFAQTLHMVHSLSRNFTTHYVNPDWTTWTGTQIESNPAFCIMPFIGIHQSPRLGSHCCFMRGIWSEKDDFFGVQSQRIRQQMLSGSRVSECKFCYDLDDRSAVSVRKSWTYYYASKFELHSKKDLIDNTKPIVYHVDLDNHCNLLCRMCDPANSHLIAKEYANLKIMPITASKKNRPSFAKNIDLSSLKLLTVTGGEPTINPGFLDFLENLQHGPYNQLSILICTNAVSLNQRFKKIIDRLPNLNFSVSIDGYDRLNHYIRWPSAWHRISSNIAYLYKRKRLSTFKTTISVYNVAALYDLYHWIDANYQDIPCSMNFVQNPEQMIPWNYPEKQQVFEDGDKIRGLSIYRNNIDFQSNVNYIQDNIKLWIFDENRLQRFYKFNDMLDQSRSIALKDYIAPLDHYRHRKHGIL